MLKERYSVLTGGYQTHTRTETVFFSSVCNGYHILSALNLLYTLRFSLGFSRGAYQIRVLSAMIHKVSVRYMERMEVIPDLVTIRLA